MSVKISFSNRVITQNGQLNILHIQHTYNHLFVLSHAQNSFLTDGLCILLRIMYNPTQHLEYSHVKVGVNPLNMC